MPPVSRVTIICALPSEAAAIADRFSLSPVCEEPFKVVEDRDTRLVVSGVGAALSTAAVGFAAGRGAPAAGDVWINCGIGGHRDLDLGTPMLADKVSSACNGDAWYPSLLFDAPCLTGEVKTFEQPVTTYPPDPCCDMEAAGFMAAAMAVAHGEFVHVLKFISDNARSGLDHIDRAFVRDLVAENAQCLSALIERLRGLSGRLAYNYDDGALEALLARWHFTHAQGEQLRRLYRRYRALAPDARDFDRGIQGCTNAAQVLQQIETRVDALPLRVA